MSSLKVAENSRSVTLYRQKTGAVAYRYGFNGKENDNEVKGGEGLQQDYGMRVYDPRLGRFLSVDPITKEYPELTPYQFSSNSPIINIDLDGLEGISSNDNREDYNRTFIGMPVITNATKEIAKKAIEEAAKEGTKAVVARLGGTVGAAGGLTVLFTLLPLRAGPKMPEGPPPAGKKWGGDYYIRNPDYKAPEITYAHFDRTLPPGKDKQGNDLTYIYETKRDVKQGVGIVDKNLLLPYYGITKQAFSPGRYDPGGVQADNFVGFIGRTDRYLAKGIETSLMLLNSNNNKANVPITTRIDNDVVSTTDATRIIAGEGWLNMMYPDWRTRFKRPENPKKTNSTASSNNSSTGSSSNANNNSNNSNSP